MTRTIAELIPDADSLFALEPEELAGVVLEHLNSLPPAERSSLNRYNFSLPHTVQDYPRDKQSAISAALDGACVNEAIQIVFTSEVLLNGLTVSSFGSGDQGLVMIGLSSLLIGSTGAHTLGGVPAGW